MSFSQGCGYGNRENWTVSRAVKGMRLNELVKG